ncbi:MAG TPA: hypothetical protein VL463_37080 [Kofleriaceae bacterium]|nr:hypothetical protein [Kofleriaceae bacterium]
MSSGVGGAAHAGPDSEVPSSFDPDHGFGAHVTLDYDFSYRHSVIERETIDGTATPGQDPTQLRREFIFSSQRHTIVPKIELGIFHDVWIYGALPYVLTDSRQLEFDQQQTPCTFTGTEPACVNRANSSTIADGLLPMTGFDAHDPTVGFTDPSSALIFRGPDRSGLDQIYLGLGWAPMNQRRDDTKPTWKLGAELRLAVGKVAKLDRTMPSRENGVGEGVDEIRLWTTFARKRGWAEPYVELSWQAPIGHTKDSPFNDPGFGARRTDKQQEASVRAGFEAIAVDNQVDHERFSLDFSGVAAAHFEGRAYSEMWEVFAFAGDAAGGGPLVLDADPTQSGVQALSHPGVSNVENYLELGGRLSARAEIGSRVHLAAFGQFRGETQHIISFTDAGVDLPTCTANTTTGCEDESNEVVNPGTAEVNPLHVPIIDLVGHRYRSVGAMTFDIGAELQILF